MNNKEENVEKKKEQCLQNLWNNTKRSNIYVIIIPKGEEKNVENVSEK